MHLVNEEQRKQEEKLREQDALTEVSERLAEITRKIAESDRLDDLFQQASLEQPEEELLEKPKKKTPS